MGLVGPREPFSRSLMHLDLHVCPDRGVEGELECRALAAADALLAPPPIRRRRVAAVPAPPWHTWVQRENRGSTPHVAWYHLGNVHAGCHAPGMPRCRSRAGDVVAGQPPPPTGGSGAGTTLAHMGFNEKTTARPLTQLGTTQGMCMHGGVHQRCLGAGGEGACC